MNESIDLSGKTIAITGGSMGIGYEAVRICLESGARVAFCARGAHAIEAAVERLVAGGAARERILGLTADVSNRHDVAHFFANAARLGNIDGLIHAAAVLGPIGSILDVAPEEWLDALRIDLYGTFLVVREACARMKERGGRIALFSGGGASGPFPNYTAYACSKVGVVRFTETVAQEMAPFGIEINCVAPGFVATRMHEQTLAAGSAAGESYLRKTKEELERGGIPAERGARTAAFFVSDGARGITGKFVAAAHDQWSHWPEHLDELRESDLFTLRRILPKERGLDWQ